MREVFARNPQLIEGTAKRNSSLQGAYLILTVRALGLGCGPMSGFDNSKVDEEFFGAGKCEDCECLPEGHVKSNFLCNLGYGDQSELGPRVRASTSLKDALCSEGRGAAINVAVHAADRDIAG